MTLYLLAVVGPVTLGQVAAPLIVLGLALLALAVVVYRKDRRPPTGGRKL